MITKTAKRSSALSQIFRSSPYSISQINKRCLTGDALRPRIFGIRESRAQRAAEERVASDPLLGKIRRQEPVRVTVTGPAGAIGYALLFRLANGELLGENQPIQLNLLELPMAMNALEGVKMELEDCAFPLLSGEITVTDDANKAFDGCEVALLVGSKPRGPGMERAELMRDNAAIFQKLGGVLNTAASKFVRVTVVGNPCNTNCLILANNAPDIPIHNFSAMTRLDHDRAVSILARKTCLPPNEVNKLAIWGNHSATMFPDLLHCTVHGVPLPELIGYNRYDRFVRHEFMPKVQQRGARIIEVRGSSSAASAASACISHTRDWILGSSQPDWTSMAVVSQGEYQVPPGLVYSYPVWCREGAYEIVSTPMSIDHFQQYHLDNNIQELLEERDAVASYLPH